MEDDYTNSTHYKSDIMLHHVAMMNVNCYAFSMCSDALGRRVRQVPLQEQYSLV